MKVGQRFDPKPQRVGGDVEQVAPMLTVSREKMEVITGYAKSARKPGRPQPDQGSLDIGEVEFALRFGGVDQASSGLGRFHGPGSHALEGSIEPDGVEDVTGLPEAVAACLEVLEAAYPCD